MLSTGAASKNIANEITKLNFSLYVSRSLWKRVICTLLTESERIAMVRGQVKTFDGIAPLARLSSTACSCARVALDKSPSVVLCIVRANKW